MEFLLGYIMIAAVMLLMGFKLIHIVVMTLFLIGVLVVLIGLFFAVCLVLLITSKRTFGEYVRLDEEPRYPVAVYKINGEEIPNLFPCEMIMRKKLYVPEKTIALRCCKLRKTVIDRNALITMIAGSAIFIPAAVIVILLMISFFSGI